MTVEQVSEALRHACNRAHERAAGGWRENPGSYLEAWEWCNRVRAGRGPGRLSWLARIHIKQCQAVLALDDTITAL